MVRRIVTGGLILGCVLIVLAVVSFAVQTLLRGQPFPEIAAAISIQDGDSLNHTGPSQYFYEGMAVRAVLNPPSF